MADTTTFKQVKSIVFGKHDEAFFNELNDSGYFDKNWNNKVKDLIKSDFYDSKGTSGFTKEQENAIINIIKAYIKDANISSVKETTDEAAADKEALARSEEAIQALNNLQKFRSKHIE